MAEVLLSERLNQVIDSLHNAPDEQARVAAFDQANEIMQGFVSGELELDPGALDTFGEFLENFAGITDEVGNQTLSELGTRALAKYEALINNREGEHGNESPEVQMAQNRIYSLNSDANQIVFDRVSFVTLQSMGLIDANINPNDMRADQISNAIDAVNLTDEQKIEYASRFVDAVIADTALFETVPPKILADAYTATRRALLSATDDATKQANQRRFNTLASRIDFLIENFSTQLNYWYVDPSNLMSLRDGYQKMFDVRQPDLQDAPNQNDRTREYNRRINGMIDSGRASLLAAIHEYEELYHLTQINPENAEELKQRWIELKSRLGEIEITPETMAVAAKYHFLDEAGNPIPQFLDENNQPSLEFTEGCKLDPTGRLAQVINLSRNDVVMENVADLEHSVADMELDKMLDEEVPWTFSEISIPDQVVQGIVQDPNKMRDEAAVQEFWDGIRTDGGSISDTGYQAALDAHVNHAIGFAHALGERVGTDQDVVYMPVEAVEEIDRLATTRTEVEGAENRKQKIGFFKRMAKNFGMTSVVSAGLTFLGKATGVAYIGAAVGTTIGVGNMIYQGLKWRKEQKKAGKPHGIKDFLSDKRNWGPAVTTGLGIAATISMATGNPELAMGFGLGAMTVGTGTSVAMTYKDAVAAGYSRGQALAGAIGVGASGILGAAFGNTVMNGIVNYVNNNTDSTLFKHPETVETTRTEYETHTERVYEDGVIERHENMMLKNNWETPQSLDARIDALMDAGLSRDDSVRYLVAFHDATDHNLGPGYFDSIGMSDSGLAALRNSINGTEVNLTPESIAAFEHFNPHISAQNQVGYIPGAPVDYTLPPNAAYDANGVLVHGNELYTTYANHDAPIFHDVTYQTPITITDTATIFTPNELAFPAGIGTFGIYEPRVVPAGYIRRLRERAGALADRITEVPEPTPDPVPDPEPDPVPDPEPDPVPDPEPDPVPDPEPDPVPPVPDPGPDGPVNPPKPPRPQPDSDLMVDIKLNQKPHQANANNNVAVKVDGKIEEVKVFSSVDGNTMKVTMIVPYSMDMDNGYYQPVYKTFSGDLRQVTVKSRATDVGMRIDMVFDGVSMHDKGRHKIYFRHVPEEGREEHITTLTKKTRFNRANVLDRNAVEEPKPDKPSKKDAFNQGAATLEDMPPAEYARLKEQRAKKPENIAAWANARSAIEALNAQTDLTEQEKAERAAQILAAAQRAVNG